MSTSLHSLSQEGVSFITVSATNKGSYILRTFTSVISRFLSIYNDLSIHNDDILQVDF